jgi:hypothetical protein
MHQHDKFNWRGERNERSKVIEKVTEFIGFATTIKTFFNSTKVWWWDEMHTHQYSTYQLDKNQPEELTRGYCTQHQRLDEVCE